MALSCASAILPCRVDRSSAVTRTRRRWPARGGARPGEKFCFGERRRDTGGGCFTGRVVPQEQLREVVDL